LTELNNDLNHTVAAQRSLQLAGLLVKTYKSNLFGTEKESNKASKIERMDVCFGIAENVLAEAGEKQLDVKVIDKSGKELVNRTRVADYQNTALDMCLDMNTNDKFTAGSYQVQVWIDAELKASKTLVLE
jgi:hypothetical protein